MLDFAIAPGVCGGMALEQALRNALYWGNLEITSDDLGEVREQLILGRDFDLVERRRTEMPYRDRKVHVRAIDRDEARFVVRDEGRGFDVAAVPGSNRPGDLEKEGGRGLVLTRVFMDEVAYNESATKSRWSSGAMLPWKSEADPC